MDATAKVLIAALVLLIVVSSLIVLWRRRSAASGGSPRPGGEGEPGGQQMLAFVLLREGRLPDLATIRTKLPDYSLQAASIEPLADSSAVSVDLASGGSVIAMIMNAPVPGGEAEAAAVRSLASYRDGPSLPPHEHHLTVTAVGDLPGDRIERLSAFTRVVAALADAAGAVGVYWGGGGVTHETAFFLDVVKAVDPPLPAWIGISLIEDGDDRVGILGSGMGQLKLPDLLLTCPRADLGDGVAYFFDLLSYVAKREEPLAEGDTVGRSETETPRVAYAPSPIDPEVTVWRVELP
jgi:hypothetical protein